MNVAQKVSSPVMLLIFVASTLVAEPERDSLRYKRANPPKWNSRDISGLFFSDALREGIQQRRVEGAKGDREPVVPNASATAAETSPTPFAWSRLVSPTTIEDEIKSLKTQVDTVVTTPGKFAGQGYIDARQHFTTLALLFAVIGEYDGEVRWKNDATTARDLFAHAASVAKVGTIQVFNAARQRKLDLDDLVGGSRLTTPASRHANNWGEVADRAPLMNRLELAVDVRLGKWTANAQELRVSRDRVIHEAEIAAMIAESLTREGMEDGDDDDYAEYCRRLQEAARQIIDAAKQQDHVKARQAASAMKQSCDACHELYRA